MSQIETWADQISFNRKTIFGISETDVKIGESYLTCVLYRLRGSFSQNETKKSSLP